MKDWENIIAYGKKSKQTKAFGAGKWDSFNTVNS